MILLLQLYSCILAQRFYEFNNRKHSKMDLNEDQTLEVPPERRRWFRNHYMGKEPMDTQEGASMLEQIRSILGETNGNKLRSKWRNNDTYKALQARHQELPTDVKDGDNAVIALYADLADHLSSFNTGTYNFKNPIADHMVQISDKVDEAAKVEGKLELVFNDPDKPEEAKKGGFGVVMKVTMRSATDGITGSVGDPFAMKLLFLGENGTTDADIQTEIDLCRLAVPGVVPVLTWGTSDYFNAFVMPFAESTLSDFIGEKSPYDETPAMKAERLRDVPKFVAHVGPPLLTLHEKGIVHRDLKPSNILLFAKGLLSSAKLCDFGCARLDAANCRTIVGAMYFMPPDAYISYNKGTHDGKKIDVFSFAVILLQILCGNVHFAASIEEFKSPRFISVDLASDMIERSGAKFSERQEHALRCSATRPQVPPHHVSNGSPPMGRSEV